MKSKVSLAALLLIIASLLLAGRCDWTETVIQSMPEDSYQEIKKANPEASDYEIAQIYTNNKK